MNISPSNFKNDFSKFLFGSDLMNLILAVYLGAVMQSFFNSIVDGAIMPILLKAIPRANYDSFSDIVIKIGDVNIKMGEIIINTIKLFVGFLLTYIVIKYVARRYI